MFAVTMGQWSQDPERKEQGKKQDHNHGLQKRSWPFQRSAWKNPMGYGPGEKRGPEELVDYQGLPPLSSRKLFWWQEACMVEQGDVDISNIKKYIRYESRVTCSTKNIKILPYCEDWKKRTCQFVVV